MGDLENISSKVPLQNGLKIPCIGFGTWNIPRGEAGVDVVLRAFENGYRLIDTAAYYQNEEVIGQALLRSKLPREELCVTSKVWNTDRGYDQTIRALRESLEKLNVGYLDTYLIHWPASRGAKEKWQKENNDTWKALEVLYAKGLVRSIGVCNFKKHHLEPLIEQAEVIPMINQVEMHPGCNQDETRKYCRSLDIVVEGWSPLGHGAVLDNEVLKKIAFKKECSVAQICLRWCLQSRVVPLPKATSSERMQENSELFGFELLAHEMKLINSLDPLGQSGLDPDKIDF